jgi:hypothetical protein
LETKLEEVKYLLVLHYFNWTGTSEELKEFVNLVKNLAVGLGGISLLGIFIPTSEWHYVIVWNTTTYEEALQTYKKYSEKYGPLKISLGKIEMFHTLEEIPFL